MRDTQDVGIAADSEVMQLFSDAAAGRDGDHSRHGAHRHRPGLLASPRPAGRRSPCPHALGLDAPNPEDGTNILLIGLDSRKDRDGNDLPDAVLEKLHAGDSSVGGCNTNTLILLHIGSTDASSPSPSLVTTTSPSPASRYTHQDQRGVRPDHQARPRTS